MKEYNWEYMQVAHLAQQLGKSALEMPMWDYLDTLNITVSSLHSA